MKIFKAMRAIFRNPGNLFGLIRTSVVYYHGKKEAMDKFKKTGRRYYCVFDPDSQKLATVTYKKYKDSYDSYQYLRQRGKFPPITLEKFVAGALYYTPSKNGAKEMTADRQQQCLDIMRRMYFSSKDKKKAG